jgi:uncharacterized protein YjdB
MVLPNARRSGAGSVLFLVLALGLGAILSGCDEDEPVGRKGVIASIDIEPNQASIEIGEVAHFVALARDARGKAVPGAVVAWASSDSSIVNVDSGGVAVGLRAGQVRISASSGGVTNDASVAVFERPVARVEVLPAEFSLAVCETATLEARALDYNGAELSGREVTWSSEDPETATVGDDGRVLGVREGTTRVIANVAGVVAAARVNVTAAVAARVAIEPSSLDLEVGQEGSLQARAYDCEDRQLHGRSVTWETDDSSVATVLSVADGGVTLRANGEGETLVRAVVEGASASASVRVAPATIASVEIVEWPGPLFVEGAHQLQAVAWSSYGLRLDDREIAWETDDPSIASVSSDGILTGVARGWVIVTASAEGHEDTLRIEVRIPHVPGVDEGTARWKSLGQGVAIQAIDDGLGGTAISYAHHAAVSGIGEGLFAETAGVIGAELLATSSRPVLPCDVAGGLTAFVEYAGPGGSELFFRRLGGTGVVSLSASSPIMEDYPALSVSGNDRRVVWQAGVPGAVRIYHLLAMVVAASIVAHSSTDVPVSRWFRKNSPPAREMPIRAER